MTPNVIAAALYLGTAASMTCMSFRYHFAWNGIFIVSVTDVALISAHLLLTCAAILAVFRPRVGHAVGLLGGAVALPWFVFTERSIYESSWIFFNREFQGELPGGEFQTFLELKILSLGLIVAVISCSLLRSLPADLAVRGIPLFRRTWPAFAISTFVLAAWFLHSVMPYREPLIADGVRLECRILHVQKRGLYLYETAVLVEQNSRFYVDHADRQLFHYRFQTSAAQGVISQTTREHVRDFVESPALFNRRTPPADPLRSWNAEGWYVVLRDSRLLAFTTEYQTVPPQVVIELFREIENERIEQRSIWTMRDICLGFCYGPAAALGFRFANEPCFALAQGATRCR